MLEETPIDMTVAGEGEETIVEVLERLATGESMEGIAGVTWRDESGIRSNEPRSRIRDVDDIPLPHWDIFPVEAYIDYAAPHGAVRGRSMPMLATRGCPYQCTFCSSPFMWTTAWRARQRPLTRRARARDAQ